MKVGDDNKIRQILRKGAHFFLLAKTLKVDTSPVCINKILDNRGFSNTFQNILIDSENPGKTEDKRQKKTCTQR